MLMLETRIHERLPRNPGTIAMRKRINTFGTIDSHGDLAEDSQVQRIRHKSMSEGGDGHHFVYKEPTLRIQPNVSLFNPSMSRALTQVQAAISV